MHPRSRLLTRFFTPALAFVLGVAAAACDGSASDIAPRPSVDGGLRRDGAVGGDGGTQTGNDGGFVIKLDTAPVQPKVTVNPDAKRLVAAPVELVGSSRACTNQVPASGNGDRWCAFHTLSKTQRDELWVINVTKAATAAVKCDGTDANCLRLSNNLWTGSTEDASHPYAHRFDGDTLIFLSGRADLFETDYEGVMYAWRPGWTRARPISGPQAFTCTGHTRAPVVFCLENLDRDANDLFHFDVRAGRLDDGNTDAPLPLVDTIVPLRKNDTLGWQGGFSASGDVFLYSTLRTGANDEQETLYAYRAEDLGTPAKRIELGKALARAQLSPDGKRLYYLKGYNYDRTGAPSGLLTSADYPTMANPAELAAKVGLYLPLGEASLTDKGIVYLQDMREGSGAAKHMPDPAKRALPGGIVDIANDVADLQPNGDQPFVFYNKRIADDGLQLTDLHVFRLNAPGGTCTIQREPTTILLSDPLLGNGALAFWADNIDLDLGVVEGWYANPADCSGATKFAGRVGAWQVVGSSGLLYADDFDFETTSTLKYAAATGNKLGAPVTVQAGIDTTYFAVAGGTAVVYVALNTVGDQNGLYLLTKTPWSPGGAAGDGGAAAPADASAGN